MTGARRDRAPRTASAAADAAVEVVVPRADRPAERPGLGAGGERLALRGEVAAGPERLAGRRARRAGRCPRGTRRARPPRIGVSNRLVRARPEDEVQVQSRSSSPSSRGPTISSAGISSRNRDGTDGLAHPPRRAAPGVRQVQPPLRAGDADVREPALLLELLLVVERPAVREQALLEAGDEDDRELEALRRVERDQRHRIGVALVRVLVGDEGGLLEQPVERVVGRQVVVAGRDEAQLEQVRPALLAVLRAVREHRPVAGRLERLVEQLGEGQHADPRPQPPDQRGELGERVPGPRREPVELAVGGAPRSRPRSSRSSRAAAARRTSIVLSPMPRAGTLMIRSKLTLSVSERRMRR